MKITFKLFATLADYLPAGTRGNEVLLEYPQAMTVLQLIEEFHLPSRLVHLVLVNGTFIPPEQRASRVLQAGEQLAIWPPIAGG